LPAAERLGLRHQCHDRGGRDRALRLREPEGIDIPTDLSQRQRFWRCPNCAVILFNDHVMMRESIRFVRVGTLDHGERLRPDAHYFVARKHPWVLLPPDVPAYETLPESIDAGPPLSPEARARMAAALRP
jgi:Glutathione-dependent formaldehyde-activating enzyme